MFKSINSIRRARNGSSGVILPIAAAFVAALVVILGAAVWFFYLAINKTQLQNIVNTASLAAIEGFIEGDGGNDLSNEFYLKALNGKARAAQILQANSGTLRGFSSQLGNIEFASASEPFVRSPTHDKGGAVTFGRWFPTEPTNAETVAPVCNARADAGLPHPYPCFEPNPTVPAAGVMRGADAVQVEACNENPITAPFSEAKQYVCEKSVATLVQRCVAFLVDLTVSQTYDSHKSLAENVGFYDHLTLAPAPQTDASAIPVIDEPLLDPTQPWNPSTNPSLASAAYFHDSAVGSLIADPNRCRAAATFLTANRFEAMLWCGMPDVRAGSLLPNKPTLHYKSDYRLRDYYDAKTGQWQQVWADVFASTDGSYVGPQPGTTVFGAINAGLRALEKNKTSGDRVMMLTFNKSIVSFIPEPAEGMSSDLGYLIQLTNSENRGTINENTASNADGAQVHPNFLDKGWIPLLDDDSGKTNAALALDYTTEVMKQKCPATSVRSIVVFTDGLANCSRYYADATRPAVTIKPEYGPYLPNNYEYSCYNGQAMDQINTFNRFGNQLGGTAPGYVNDWQNNPSIATALKTNSIAMTVVLAGDTVAPNTLEVPVPGSNPTRFYNQDELSALGWGGRVDSSWNSLFKITESFARFPSGTYPNMYGWIIWAGLNIPKAGYYYGAPNQVWAGTVMDTGGTFCPIRPKCIRDGDLMKQPPCNNLCPAGSEYIQDPSNTTPGAPRVLNPLCLVNNPAAADPYSGCAKNDPGGTSNSRGLTCTYYDRTESEQAADCAVKTVSGNPYILVAQDDD